MLNPEDLDMELFGSFLIFKIDEHLFRFRGEKVPPDLYEFPFTF